MKKFSKLLALLLAAAMLCALAACGGNGGGQPAGGSDGGNQSSNGLDGKTIGYVTINSASPWSGVIDTKLGEFVKAEGGTYRNLDAQTDVAKVAEYCQQMIDAAVDALVIFGGDPAANSQIAKDADAAGIPVFMAGLDVTEEGREYVKSVVGPDQEKMTYDIGQRVIEDNGADAGCLTVIISGVPFLDDYKQRDAGFARAMAETNYDVKETVYAFSSRTDAKSYMEQFIQTYGNDIDIVMGMDDDLTMGAIQAIDEAVSAGTLEAGKIKVYSLIGQNDAIQAVKDGKLQMTVMNRAEDISAGLVEDIKTVLGGGEVEYNHYTNLTTIDASNVDDYLGKGEF
ncbi:MAG: sugar ABC transporter substrate-binding protein [Oscillospiraceae bacterium]|nr:sugar ABC transporter substrate-binding protein [Oscillospiraceae bacterium]